MSISLLQLLTDPSATLTSADLSQATIKPPVTEPLVSIEEPAEVIEDKQEEVLTEVAIAPQDDAQVSEVTEVSAEVTKSEKFSEEEVGTEVTETHVTLQLKDDYSYGHLFSDGVTLSNEGVVGYLKVPVAVLGEWKHPTYGDISFTEKDFADIVRNFDNQVTGYEPGLYKGHDINPNSADGAPAYAYLEQLERVEDVLYGYWGCVDEATYEQVDQGQFRYSSAEIYRNALNKEDGTELGTVLTGIALTNKPFLTKLPRVKTEGLKLSDCTPNSVGLVFPLVVDKLYKQLEKNTMSNLSVAEQPNTTVVAEEPATADVEKTEVQEVLQQAKEDVSLARLKALEEKIEKYELSERLEAIQKLNLSAATKQSFSEKINSRKISLSAADELLDSLKVISAENDSLLLTQKGTTTETDEANNSQKYSQRNPYQHILDSHEQILSSAHKATFL